MGEHELGFERVYSDPPYTRYLKHCNRCGKKGCLYEANQDMPRGYFCKDCSKRIMEIW